MRITNLIPRLIGKYVLVEVSTDEGLVGVGESGCVGFPDASAAAIAMCGEYLVGRSAHHIQDHQQVLYRSRHFRGAVIRGAISAIDIALWDLAGQYHGVPVHRLLGGPTRSAVPAYQHAKGATREVILDRIAAADAGGFRYVGHLSPWLDEPREHPYTWSLTQKLQVGVESIGLYRERFPSMGLCVEGHRRSKPGEAVAFARAIEQFHPVFLEDPVAPDNLDAMATVAARTSVPIATGERLTTPEEFAMLLRRDAVDYLRVNLATVGGITAAMKIAALADAFGVELVPHAPLSPVTTAACLQLAASVSSVALQEYTGDEHQPPKRAIVDHPASTDGHGNLLVPDRPGLGITLATEDQRRHVETVRRGFPMRRDETGHPVDQ